MTADGVTLTVQFTDYAGADPSSGAYTEHRVGKVAAGAHAASGAWQADKVTSVSGPGFTVAYQMTDGGLQMKWNGQSYDAKFDGKEYPLVGDPGKTQVSVKKLSETSIEETDKRDGKVTDITHLAVSADGKTLSVQDRDPQHGTTTSFVMDKQP